MKKFWALCGAFVCMICLSAGIILTGCGDKTDPADQTYTITLANSDAYSLQSSHESAKEGDTVVINVSLVSEDDYLISVNYNNRSCSKTDDGWSFTMPAENVTVSAQLGHYSEVTTDGYGFATLVSNTTIAKMANDPFILVEIDDPYTTILNTLITPTNQNPIPADAITVEKITNIDLVGSSGSNAIAQVKIHFNPELINLGTSWLTMNFDSGNTSDEATLVVKVSVLEYIELSSSKATITFDISDISNKSEQYTLRVWDDDFIDGPNLWNGKSFNDYLVTADPESDTITFTIDYILGHDYSIRLSRGEQYDYYTNLLISARNEGGSSTDGYTQYTGDTEIEVSDKILVSGGTLTFQSHNLDIELSVNETSQN